MKLSKIMDTAYIFTSMIIDEASHEEYRAKHPNAEQQWNDSIERPFVENLIAGALFAYHDQLRKEMADKGVNLPDLEP